MAKIAVIGAGMGGLCAAIKAREAGHDVTIFEKADDVGGTWRANRYPGVACDVPALLYQFSFAPNSGWSHHFARGAEIHAYTRSLVDRFDLKACLRLGEGVEDARWDEATARWSLTTDRGATEAFDVIVPALGQLSRPVLPDIPGIGSFSGEMWHAADWPQDAPVAGKRIGVIGTAASAVQLIPELAREAAELVVFQRTPNWCIPRNDVPVADVAKRLAMTKPDVAMSVLALQRELTFTQFDEFSWQAFEWTAEGRAALEASARHHLRVQVADPELRRKLTPDYPIGCKRILLTDDFYPALQRDNVVLETDAIVAVEPGGVRTAAGLHEIDALVLATGFETTQWAWPLTVTGRDGVTLADYWQDRARAYLGIMVPPFPNMFVLYGPNTNLAHNSISYMIECQVGFMLDALQTSAARDARTIAVTEAAQAAFLADIDQRLARTVWADPHCNSWYKSGDGRIVQNWAGNCAAYRKACETPDERALTFK